MKQNHTIKEKKQTEGNPQKIKVLMYHRIVKDESLSSAYPQLCIHIDEFRQHLALLERWGLTPITFEDYRLYREGEINLPKKPVIITFDDGYLDTYEQAFPVLQEYGMKAVVFVLGDRSVTSNNWDQSSSHPSSPLLEERQILEMHQAGFEIGAHSMTHARLPFLPREKAWEEISRSRMLLEILLNAPVKTFAFPYGLADSTTKKMLEDAGYAMACGTYTGPAVFGRDPFEVRRIFIPGSTHTLQMAARLLAPYEHYAWLRWQLKQMLVGDRTLAKTNGQRIPSKVLSDINLAKKG